MPILVSPELGGSGCSVEGKMERKGRKDREQEELWEECGIRGSTRCSDLGWAAGLGLGSLDPKVK